MNTYLEALYTSLPLYTILCALSAWCGKVIATRIAAKETGILQERLTLLKAELDRTQKQLEGEIQRRVHIHKIQFEKEFTIYQQLMSSVNRVRRAFYTLHLTLKPIFDDPEKSKAHYDPLRKEFRDAYGVARDMIIDNKAFYAEDVFAHCDRFIELSVDEISSLNVAPDEGVHDWRKQEEMKKKFNSIIQDIEKSIHKRIQSLQVE